MDTLVLKIILILVMMLLTLIFALVPAKLLALLRKKASHLSLDDHRWPSLVLSLLSCFTGGVFMAACFLDLLPHALETLEAVQDDYHVKIDYPVAMAISCFGFFLVYFVEEVTIACIYGGGGHSHGGVMPAEDDEGTPSPGSGVEAIEMDEKVLNEKLKPLESAQHQRVIAEAKQPISSSLRNSKMRKISEEPSGNEQTSEDSDGKKKMVTLDKKLDGEVFTVNNPSVPKPAILKHPIPVHDNEGTETPPMGFIPFKRLSNAAKRHSFYYTSADGELPVMPTSLHSTPKAPQSRTNSIWENWSRRNSYVITSMLDQRRKTVGALAHSYLCADPQHDMDAEPGRKTRKSQVGTCPADMQEVFTSLLLAEPESCEGPFDLKPNEDPPILTVRLPHAHSHNFRSLTLLLALSFHSMIEGMAFGVQVNNEDVLMLFLSVIIHKCIVAFSMGLQLARTHTRNMMMVFVSAFLFAAMSPIGCAIGIAVDQSHAEDKIKNVVLLVAEGLAVGTFLYVTFFEVLSHERDNEHPNLLKLLVTVLGFGLIAGLQTLEHEHEPDEPNGANVTTLTTLVSTLLTTVSTPKA